MLLNRGLNGGTSGGGPALASGRYLKLNFPATTGFVQLYEVAAYTTYGGANILTGTTATADTAGAGAASNAIDGNTTTFWATGGVNPPDSNGHWIKFDAGAGNKLMPRIIDLLPSSTTEAPPAFTASLSDDNTTFTPIITIPTVQLPDVVLQKRRFTVDGDTAGGNRYHWVKITGNNFVGSSVCYIKEIKLNDVNGNCAIENIALGGTGSNKGYAFGRADASDGNGGAMANGGLNTTFGVDHGKKRKPTSITLDFSDVTLYDQNGFKQWQLYASDVSIGDAGGTLLLDINDAGGTPANGESRTWVIP